MTIRNWGGGKWKIRFLNVYLRKYTFVNGYGVDCEEVLVNLEGEDVSINKLDVNSYENFKMVNF